MNTSGLNSLDAVEIETNNRLKLRGFSRSGVATWLCVPEFRAVFDLGECPQEALRAENVFITHGHDDHIRCLTRHMAMRQLLKLTPATYYVPHEIFHLVLEMIDLEKRLGNLKKDDDPRLEYAPAWSGDLAGNSHVQVGRFTMQSFAVDHRVPSVGYTIYDRRKRLLPAWVGAPGVDIGRARKAGEVVDETYQAACFTFLGDHLATAFELPHIWESNTLVVEVTFLDGKVEDAQRKGHVHIDELVEVLKKREPRPGQTLVLKHFSPRYSWDQIMEFMNSSAVPAAWRINGHCRLLLQD